MPFQPRPGDTIELDGEQLRFVTHPAVKRIVHGQAGRAAHVYRADGNRGAFALKVFKPMYRQAALLAQATRLAPFASLPGLTVCGRTVIAPSRHGALLQRHPDLLYAVLMPWIQGPTWHDVINTRRVVDRTTSIRMASALAHVLSGLERRQMAHCDLSAPNLLLPMLDGGAGGLYDASVALVDVEQLYAPGIERPDPLVAGTPGYAHLTASGGAWDPSADRFAGAILLAEMLAWQNDLVREQSGGQSFFEAHEMHQETPRFRLLRAALSEDWGDDVARLLTRAWLSRTPDECPTINEWMPVLDHLGRGAEQPFDDLLGSPADAWWTPDSAAPDAGGAGSHGYPSSASAAGAHSSGSGGPSVGAATGAPEYVSQIVAPAPLPHPFIVGEVSKPTTRPRPASNHARAGGLAVDLVFSTGAAVLVGLGLALPLKVSYVVPALLIWLGYYVLSWVLMSATPGQALFGVRVVDAQSDLRPTLWQSMVRTSAYVLSIVSLGAGFFIALRSPGASSLADWLARTRTITTR